MRDFIVRVLSTTEGSASITLFSAWHFLYILVIVGATFVTAVLLKDKSERVKQKVLNGLAIALPALYIADFFFMPLANADFTIDVDKLPFHICTVMAFFVPLVQFNKRLTGIRSPVVCLSIVASLMYLTYPGTAIGDVLPWAYRVLQTFAYHGVMFAWGVLNLTTGRESLRYCRLWKELVFVLCMVVWASIGNAVYSHDNHIYDWFFVNGVTFPFVPEPLMPPAVVTAIFGMCFLICTIYNVAERLICKHRMLGEAHESV